MKRSNQVMISAVLVAAVASASARAQEARTDTLVNKDTIVQQPPAVYTDVVVPRHHGFFYRINVFRFFGRHCGSEPHHQMAQVGPRSTQPPAAPQPTTHTPRTHGFGNSMHKSAHS